MNGLRNGSLVSGVLFALLHGSGVVAGELGSTARGPVLEEIVVTARRREEAAQGVPIPVTALSARELEERGVEDVTGIHRMTPNLDIQRSGSSQNAAQVFLRGIGQSNWAPPQDPKVGIYVDGLYLGRPQGAVFDLMDVERVEVLRGPQGTLFGRNTTAGLVHIVTRKPTQEFSGRIQGGAGNDDQLSLNGVLNVPIADTLAVRVAAQGRWADGYVENTATGEDWNDTDRQSVRAQLAWAPVDGFDALLTASLDRIRERPSLGECTWLGPASGQEATATGGLPFIAHVFGVLDEIRSTCEATRRYHSSDNDPDNSKVDARTAIATMTWQLRDVELTSITGWRKVEELNQSWGWATDTAGSPGYLEVLAFEDSEQEQWSQELRLSGASPGQRLTWVLGAYWFDEDATMPQVVPIFRGVSAPSPAESPIFYAPAPPGLGVATFGELALATQMLGSAETGFDADNSSWATFFEVDFQVSDALSVTAGARYTEDDREFVRTQTLLGGVPNPTLICPGGEPPGPRGRCEQSKSFDEITPRVIVSYLLAPELMVYGGWSKGYSSGGFNSDIRMRAYDPETSKNWEAGAKSTWLDRRLVANVTAFHNTYQNQQITVSRLVGGQPQADLINAQEATLYGVEAELTFKPTANWLLTAAAGWIDGEYDEFLIQDTLLDEDFTEIIVTRDLSDTEVIRNSPYTLSLSAAYTARLGGGHVLDTRVGWYQRGRIYNTLETLESSRQDAYGLLDGRISWQLPNGRTRVSLWGTNLLDEAYFPSAIDLSRPGDTGTVTRFWGEPRRFRLEIAHEFGG